jgi:amidase
MIESDWKPPGVVEIAHSIRAQEISAVDILEHFLSRIANLEPTHKAYVVQIPERARERALAIDAAIKRGDKVGPLAGVPMALKDIFDITGLPTTAAMAIRRQAIAEQDATVVRRLEQAGAVILGKLTLTEGVYAEHVPPFTAPVNPWNADYWVGASSTGSGVAVSAGLCSAALGSETGGSIKLPAAANGVTALKPTWGRVSRHGVFELAATLDHVGPFAQSAADAAAVLSVIAGADDADPTASQVAVPDYAATLSSGIDGLRIGIDPQWIASCVDTETANALDDAVAVLEQAGAKLITVKVPDVTDMIWDWFPICAVQTALAHQETFPSRRDEYGPALSELLDMGNAVSGLDYQKLILRRDGFRGRLNELFSRIDVLALPVLAFPVPSLERMSQVDDEMIAGFHRFTCPFNLTGSPGIVLPCGFNSEAMPIVFQLVGRHFEEDILLSAGAAFQDATQWHLQRPNCG